jgi:hypothetical protein
LSDLFPDAPTLTAPRLVDLGLDPARPLVIVDVDEVLGLFVKGFGAFLLTQGLELRLERFALFQNVYRPGAPDPVSWEEAKASYDRFFESRCADLEATPDAVPALARLKRKAEILILSNAPAEAEAARVRWLRKNGLDYPLVINRGPKGPMTAGLVAQIRARSAFIDDLIPHLDSVAEHAPQTRTFQHVADPRLRPLAPRSERHVRIDDWRELGEAVEQAVAD